MGRPIVPLEQTVMADDLKTTVQRKSEQSKPRILAVFDFDHTLVDGNTDTWITKMHPPAVDMLRSYHKQGWCWTDIMETLFLELHSQELHRDHYHDCFVSLSFVPGMIETCQFLARNGIESIIISDSNTEFINHLLTREKLENVFSKIYSNPANWDVNGCLHIERYHSHGCTRCPPNLCKGEVLKKHLEDGCGAYDHVVYIGDGKNDLCPCLWLKQGDFALGREGYKLCELLKEKGSALHCEVVPWSSGFEVMELFTRLSSSFS